MIYFEMSSGRNSFDYTFEWFKYVTHYSIDKHNQWVEFSLGFPAIPFFKLEPLEWIWTFQLFIAMCRNNTVVIFSLWVSIDGLAFNHSVIIVGCDARKQCDLLILMYSTVSLNKEKKNKKLTLHFLMKNFNFKIVPHSFMIMTTNIKL